jgi:membrane protease YdiL (CAAX protease family)
MSQVQLSFLLSLLCVGMLASSGRRPYVDEFGRRWRQVAAAGLLVCILALAVLSPLTSFGEAADIDPETIWFPTLFAGHMLLVAFLFAWWRLLGGAVPAGRFLSLSADRLADKVRRGVGAGCGGWLLTVMVTGTAAGVAAATGRVSEPAEIPPIIVWLAGLPLASKLFIVAVAMTVEEAFFRGFLQPRFGLLVSSTLFALSHFNYGLPFMVVGVFTISLVIGRTFARSGDLLPCIVAHGVFDAVQLLVVLPWAVHMWSS